jgi:hypothetical protein
MKNFGFQGLTASIKMIAFNFSLETPNVNKRERERERECLKKIRTFLTCSKRTERRYVKDRHDTESSPIKSIADLKDQKQDGHHC